MIASLDKVKHVFKKLARGAGAGRLRPAQQRPPMEAVSTLNLIKYRITFLITREHRALFL